jgi:LAS superfamily LD-carboxypeptidase LdcB
MKSKNLFLIVIFCVIFSACWSPKKSDSSTPSSSRTPTPESTKKDKDSDSKTDEKTNKNSNNKMDDSTKDEVKSVGFTANLPSGFTLPTDPVGQKMLKEYGAMFVAKNGAVPPPKVVFNNEAEVSSWQSGISKSSESIGGATVELQTPAMKALKEAIADAKQNGADITPNGGSDAARRNYAGTVTNWKSRVDPGMVHWVGKGKITQAEATRIKSLPIPEQISEIFKLEAQGIFFAKDLSKSIIYSVAPPGTSQHISMLAFDVKEHANSKVRDILAKYGWFQTVVSDLPHFTYLGVSESELPKLGLKKVSDGGRTYWIPE